MNFKVFIHQLRQKYTRCSIYASNLPVCIWINWIRVPDDLRGRGIGTEISNEIKKYAIMVSKPIMLHPDLEAKEFWQKQNFIHLKDKPVTTYKWSEPAPANTGKKI